MTEKECAEGIFIFPGYSTMGCHQTGNDDDYCKEKTRNVRQGAGTCNFNEGMGQCETPKDTKTVPRTYC